MLDTNCPYKKESDADICFAGEVAGDDIRFIPTDGQALRSDDFFSL